LGWRRQSCVPTHRLHHVTPELQQCLMLLALAMAPVALLWWAWLRLLNP